MSFLHWLSKFHSR